MHTQIWGLRLKREGKTFSEFCKQLLLLVEVYYYSCDLRNEPKLLFFNLYNNVFDNNSMSVVSKSNANSH